MTNSPTVYGFNYKFRGRNYAIGVDASDEGEAVERLRAMAAAVFVAPLVAEPSEPQSIASASAATL
jgi:hypothetical protein